MSIKGEVGSVVFFLLLLNLVRHWGGSFLCESLGQPVSQSTDPKEQTTDKHKLDMVVGQGLRRCKEKKSKYDHDDHNNNNMQ